MRKEDIKKTFNNITPSDLATQRMLTNILSHSDVGRKVNIMNKFNLKIAIPAFVLTAVITGSILTTNIIANKQDIPSKNAGDAREDMIMILKDQFQMDKKHYILLSDAQMREFKLSTKDIQSKTGDKITTIKTSVDSSLIGCDVYKFLPAGGEALVVVKKGNDYKLFRFFAFDSYQNNQDEDTIAYLKLYGINSPSDIAKIQFIGHSEQSKIKGTPDIKGEITDTAKIKMFYDFYSVIKNSSDQYFKKLFNFKSKENQSVPSDQSQKAPDDTVVPDAVIPDPDSVSSNAAKSEKTTAQDTPLYANDLPTNTATRDIGNNTVTNPSTVIDPDKSSGQGQSVPGSVGSAGDALYNSLTIRIYNQGGFYHEAEYYPNIGFISRHEVNDTFAAFLKEYIK